MISAGCVFVSGLVFTVCWSGLVWERETHLECGGCDSEVISPCMCRCGCCTCVGVGVGVGVGMGLK